MQRNPNPLTLDYKEFPPPSSPIRDMDVQPPSQSPYETLTLIPNPARETPYSSNSTGNMDAAEANPFGIIKLRTFGEIPRFMRKVFNLEIETTLAGSSYHHLVIVAVHAVFLESGFVAVDPATNAAVSGGRLPEQWSSSGPAYRIRYTLPSLAMSACNLDAETVILKFQILGRFVAIYGCLDSKDLELRRVSVDDLEFAPILDYLYGGYDEEGNLGTIRRRAFFEFWKTVKDGLSTPLLIALCNKMGLPPPPCLMVLPADVKHKILELVSPADAAKVGCSCLELKYVLSNDELWKEKFEQEFGVWDGKWGAHLGSWKERFVFHWEARSSASMPMEEHVRRFMPHLLRRGRLHPFGVPPPGNWMIGGDEDRMLIPFGVRRVRHGFSPLCNFGWFHTMYS